MKKILALTLALTVVSIWAATGTPSAVRIQDGVSSINTKSSKITVTGGTGTETNLNVGSLVVSNNASFGVPGNVAVITINNGWFFTNSSSASSYLFDLSSATQPFGKVIDSAGHSATLGVNSGGNAFLASSSAALYLSESAEGVALFGGAFAPNTGTISSGSSAKPWSAVYSTPNAFRTLTDGATVTLAADKTIFQHDTVTLGGNRTLAISGAVAGMEGTLIVKQDATGSRTLTLPATSKVINGGSGAVTLSTAANSIDVLSWVYDGSNYLWTYGKNFN